MNELKREELFYVEEEVKESEYKYIEVKGEWECGEEVA